MVKRNFELQLGPLFNAPAQIENVEHSWLECELPFKANFAQAKRKESRRQFKINVQHPALFSCKRPRQRFPVATETAISTSNHVLRVLDDPPRTALPPSCATPSITSGGSLI